MSIFEDLPFLIPIISVILALSGVLVTFYYFRKQTNDFRKQAGDRVHSDNRILSLQTESLAVQKKKEEESLAKEIIAENKRLALDVKDSMIREFTGVIGDLRSDLSLQREILVGEMKLMKQTDAQIQKDLEYFVHNQQTINDRMQKNIDFMTQFMWGAGAKSDPAYLSGEIETQEHKNEPSVGMFKNPDSTETQKTKDERQTTADQRQETADQRQETQDQYQETKDQKNRQEEQTNEKNSLNK